jgi:uncharacterized protein YndB with AHSA1/START domain
MRSNTATITIAAPAARVFDLLADPASLPRWAVGFARAIHATEEGWEVETPSGARVPIRYVTQEAHGVVDFHTRPALQAEASAHARVLPNGDGAEVLFTQFQSPGLSDEAFAAQVRAVGHELVTLRALAEVECPL